MELAQTVRALTQDVAMAHVNLMINQVVIRIVAKAVDVVVDVAVDVEARKDLL
jgi:hypothetical protein